MIGRHSSNVLAQAVTRPITATDITGHDH